MLSVKNILSTAVILALLTCGYIVFSSPAANYVFADSPDEPDEEDDDDDDDEDCGQNDNDCDGVEAGDWDQDDDGYSCDGDECYETDMDDNNDDVGGVCDEHPSYPGC